MLDFPSNPTVGQSFPQPVQPGVPVYQWDGVKWTTVTPSYGSKSPIYADGSVPMQAALTLAGLPSNPTDAVEKTYADSIAALSAQGFVNKLRNGTFDVWQRGVSLGVANNTVYTADGWMVASSGSPSVVAVANSFARPNGLARIALQLQGGAAATNLSVSQRIESYVACPLGNNVPMTFQAVIYNGTNSAFTPSLGVYTPASQNDVWTGTQTTVLSVPLQPCPAGQWTKVAYTFVVPANIVYGLQVMLGFGNALTVSPYIVDVAEADLRATPSLPTGLCANPPTPEMRPVAIELPFCQRYFNQWTAAITNELLTLCFVQSATTVRGLWRYPPMRAIPAAPIMSAPNTWRIVTASAVVNPTALAPYGSTTVADLDFTVSGLTAGQAGLLQAMGPGASIAVSAEL